jgi:hypothetical protein
MFMSIRPKRVNKYSQGDDDDDDDVNIDARLSIQYLNFIMQVVTDIDQWSGLEISMHVIKHVSSVSAEIQDLSCVTIHVIYSLIG